MGSFRGATRVCEKGSFTSNPWLTNCPLSCGKSNFPALYARTKNEKGNLNHTICFFAAPRLARQLRNFVRDDDHGGAKRCFRLGRAA